MLPIDIPPSRYEVPGSWDGKSKKLISIPAIHLELEHSLLSISRWEAIWKIPFIENEKLTGEQFLSYCQCMTINKQKVPNVYQFLRDCDVQKILEYMHDPMTARTIRKKSGRRGSHRIMTSEYFYFLMTQYNIPFDCDKWHFNRLVALIDCCSSNSGDEPPMSYRDRQKLYASLNDKRRKALGTRG